MQNIRTKAKFLSFIIKNINILTKIKEEVKNTVN